ncbi:hypothetical protein [Desulfatibacillum aliphaticivorans]|uniref:hypothetical protein n=1 Tax=Desulfatibacillum aliphaticivorans TaxID=218208 RepID=UPI000423F513|nr:hypothetical protein [Desulfatibacillum aliphaticivorans]
MEALAQNNNVQALVVLFILLLALEVPKQLLVQAMAWAFKKLSKKEPKEKPAPASGLSPELDKINETLKSMDVKIAEIQKSQSACRESLADRFVGKEIARTLFQKTDAVEKDVSFLKGQRNGSRDASIRMQGGKNGG